MDHQCIHEQDLGRFLQICNTELPEIKTMLRGIYEALEGNGKTGLKTRTALLEENVRDLRSDILTMPCPARMDKCQGEFEKVKSRIKILDEKLSSPKRMVIHASILTLSGFAGGFTAMWTLARFYLADIVDTKLPVLVRDLLPELLK